MKYGIMCRFIQFASYKKRVLKEYRAIVERTPGIGSMKNNMFVMTMYAAAFVIALYMETMSVIFI